MPKSLGFLDPVTPHFQPLDPGKIRRVSRQKGCPGREGRGRNLQIVLGAVGELSLPPQSRNQPPVDRGRLEIPPAYPTRPQHPHGLVGPLFGDHPGPVEKVSSHHGGNQHRFCTEFEEGLVDRSRWISPRAELIDQHRGIDGNHSSGSTSQRVFFRPSRMTSSMARASFSVPSLQIFAAVATASAQVRDPTLSEISRSMIFVKDSEFLFWPKSLS